MTEPITDVQPDTFFATDAAQTPASTAAGFRTSEDAAPPSTPRWVKAFGIGLAVLLLVFAGMHLTGNAPMEALHHGTRLP